MLNLMGKKIFTILRSKFFVYLNLRWSMVDLINEKHLCAIILDQIMHKELYS